PVYNREKIYMEQAALSYYLYENNYFHIAHPIPTEQGDWFAIDGDKQYMVVKVVQEKHRSNASHGTQLAEFHHLGSLYTFEPQRISSYGQWKQLWIDKLTMFESYVHQEVQENDHYF